mgnify:CR=1 FL=1
MLSHVINEMFFSCKRLAAIPEFSNNKNKCLKIIFFFFVFASRKLKQKSMVVRTRIYAEIHQYVDERGLINALFA